MTKHQTPKFNKIPKIKNATKNKKLNLRKIIYKIYNNL